MGFKSILEILGFAISKEQASVRFYQDLLPHLIEPAAKTLFEVMTIKEQEHVAALQLEVQKLGHTVDVSEEAYRSVLHGDEHLETNDEILSMSFVEALVLAIQKERAAFRLYTKLLATVQDEQLGGVLMELAEEEMRHVLQLEQEYEAIMHHKS